MGVLASYLQSLGDCIKACWDTTREPFSLGGLLIFRQELEQLAQLAKRQKIHVTIDSSLENSSQLNLIRLVFASSYPVYFTHGKKQASDWPLNEQTETPFFSYQSFKRVIELWHLTKEAPRLKWNMDVMDATQSWRKNFLGSLYTVHLKQVENGTFRESNAQVKSWGDFFCRYAKPGKRNFVLLGSDPMPDELLKIPGVHAENSLPLSSQLCLISLSDGFLGMASGICQAAVFTGVPYVIFKNPQHHPEEMQRELGNAESFPFALPSQKFWRREDTVNNIESAFKIVMEEARA